MHYLLSIGLLSRITIHAVCLEVLNIGCLMLYGCCRKSLTTPFSDSPYFVTDHIQLIPLEDIVGEMRPLKEVCIPFLYDLTARGGVGPAGRPRFAPESPG